MFDDCPMAMGHGEEAGAMAGVGMRVCVEVAGADDGARGAPPALGG